jgi:hypothetical protein
MGGPCPFVVDGPVGVSSHPYKGRIKTKQEERRIDFRMFSLRDSILQSKYSGFA